MPSSNVYLVSPAVSVAPTQPIAVFKSKHYPPTRLTTRQQPPTRNARVRPRWAKAVVPAVSQRPSTAIRLPARAHPDSPHQRLEPVERKQPQFDKHLFKQSLIVCGIAVGTGVLGGVLVSYGYSTSLGISILGLIGILAAWAILAVGLVILIISLFKKSAA